MSSEVFFKWQYRLKSDKESFGSSQIAVISNHFLRHYCQTYQVLVIWSDLVGLMAETELDY